MAAVLSYSSFRARFSRVHTHTTMTRDPKDLDSSSVRWEGMGRDGENAWPLQWIIIANEIAASDTMDAVWIIGIYAVSTHTLEERGVERGRDGSGGGGGGGARACAMASGLLGFSAAAAVLKFGGAKV